MAQTENPSDNLEQNPPLSSINADEITIDDLDPKTVKILIALSGGIDSAVAAFLLKKRGFQVIGLGMIFIDKEKIIEKVNKIYENNYTSRHSFELKSMEERRNKEDRSEFLKDSCSIDKLDVVNNLCKALDIPFYAVNAQPIFGAYITDQLVATKLSGETFNPCVNCNVVKIRLLNEKAKVLNAQYIATGHYAKIYKARKGGKFQIFASNDTENDQSHLLSSLDQDSLSNLIFPLADLRKPQVEKLAASFQLPAKRTRNSDKICFTSGVGLCEYIESLSPADFRREGPIISLKSGSQLGEHLGLHRYQIGSDNIESKYSKQNLLSLDKGLKVVKMDPKGKIYVGYDEDMITMGVGLKQTNFIDGMDLSRPINIFMQYDLKLPSIAGLLIIKNNKTSILEFKSPIKGLSRGQYLTFYDKQGKGAKVLGHGKIYYLDDLSVQGRTSAVESEQLDEHGNPIKKKVNPLRF